MLLFSRSTISSIFGARTHEIVGCGIPEALQNNITVSPNPTV